MIWFRRQRETKKVGMTLVVEQMMLVVVMLIHLQVEMTQEVGRLTRLLAVVMKVEMQVETHLLEAMKVAERQIHLLGEMTQAGQKVVEEQAMWQLLGMLEQKQAQLMLVKERLKVSLLQKRQ